jgi:hypothetical protein
MILFVSNGKLTNELCKLTWHDFEFLTGVKVNLTKRIARQVRVLRIKGHTFLSEATFLQGCKYAKLDRPSNILECVYVSNEEVILKDIKEDMRILHVTNNATDYRIIE